MTMAPPRTLAAFIDQTGGRAACLALSRDPNAKVTILLFPPGAARPAYVAKVPTTDAAALSVEREAERLAEVGDRVAGPVSATIPELVATVEHLGRPVLVMTALPGQSMLAAYHSWRHTARREAVAADFAAAGDWLAGLHSAVGAKGAVGANGQASVARMLDGVADVLGHRFGGQPGADADLAQLAALRGRLEGHRTPQSVVHGDFWAGNLLTERGRVLGVIDWEHACLTGSPVRDLARFATSYSLYLDRHTRHGTPGSRPPGAARRPLGSGRGVRDRRGRLVSRPGALVRHERPGATRRVPVLLARRAARRLGGHRCHRGSRRLRPQPPAAVPPLDRRPVMTMTLPRPVAAPPQETPAKPVRGSAQRAAVATLVLAVIFQPVLHPTGPGNSSPVDLLLIASIVTALVWLAATHRKLRAPYVIPVLLFIAAGAASGLVSPLPTTALSTLAIDILLFRWCTTVVNVVSGPRAMR